MEKGNPDHVVKLPGFPKRTGYSGMCLRMCWKLPLTVHPIKLMEHLENGR